MFVVTDLTRFSPGNPHVCTALIEIETGRCVRPWPYFTFEQVRKAGIIPGATFSGHFTPRAGRAAPHLEDCDYASLKYHGAAARDVFRGVLVNGLSQSVNAGFGYTLQEGAKVIPLAHKGARSIITIRVDPAGIEILPDGFDPKKIKVNFQDASGQRFRYMPITDLGFYDHASTHRDAVSLAKLNAHLRNSHEVLLRVGLSRRHAVGERDGYWVQVNGIYTFPSKLQVVRGYA